jgi:pyruvate/2-oxoglutarate/acetoin dehydrogenase E1 component/TPP-dependent pyruvate/acetoin dehydrogenase alpha subunit
MASESPEAQPVTAQFTAGSILRDYRIAYQSRQMSLLGRKEVLTGKAKFGIFGDGKEVAQVALARAFRKGDFRAGYYRDQTLMMALGLARLDELFAQLYADADAEREPSSAGRQMNAHFATPLIEPDGSWRRAVDGYNSSADLSPTGSQMPRLVGLAQASSLYRRLEGLDSAGLSNRGNEIAFGTIGNASCAEGMFWESVNAAGVLGVPMLLSIWDDDYGISVSNEHQLTKGDLSALLGGFQRAPGEHRGYDIYRVKGWDYAGLCETYLSAAEVVRRDHVPAIVHVVEMTQPQGHSTSGSQERYKSEERLSWEREHDCVARMRHWILRQELAGEEELARLEAEDEELVREAQHRAWDRMRAPLDAERDRLVELVETVAREAGAAEAASALRRKQHPLRRDLAAAAQDVLLATRDDDGDARRRLLAWRDGQLERGGRLYGTHLYAEGAGSALEVPVVEASFAPDAEELRGFEILNAAFDAALAREPRLVAFGEDLGRLGDVNQGFLGLQEKHGETRVFDTGIRETTILGQAIGLAQRGFRPIAEIQYLDYLLYALQIVSDDLATLRWRTAGRQKAPVIIRTRGHRLEGVWHSGSPMGGIVHLTRGLWICVPRNMVQAAGMYNTLLAADDPGLVIEVLNGYRLRERLPSNIGEMTVPLGVPEVLRPGRDVTLVTYGACCRIAQEAAAALAEADVEVEIVDVQTLQPFDRHGRILESLRKTSRIAFVDEDVPGGASAFMMQQVLEGQGGYRWLDSAPITICGKAHRPAYGSDGDYFSKPNREEIFAAVYALMHESDPRRYPSII